MFDDPSKRYMTKSLAEKIHPEIAMHLWNFIDKERKAGREIDYLQVFELTVIKETQSVLHRQEQPSYKEQWIIDLKNTEPITTTIWCIDDGQTQMMMFPEDY
ncbi:DUF960 family protein [Salipaludibacillus sp. CF4.18]|uniref:DUF960 family protein n=1 Tax=Salipaludibacillus sp. CF4.18 TaxID=3373081 RepID=UPI003EE800DA